MFSLPNLNSRFFIGSPLRHRNFALAVSAALLALLILSLLMLGILLGSMHRDAVKVFVISLYAATAFSAVPMAILWWLDRRERESPWLFLFMFLWGGLIATSLALPINNYIIADI